MLPMDDTRAGSSGAGGLLRLDATRSSSAGAGGAVEEGGSGLTSETTRVIGQQMIWNPPTPTISSSLLDGWGGSIVQEVYEYEVYCSMISFAM